MALVENAIYQSTVAQQWPLYFCLLSGHCLALGVYVRVFTNYTFTSSTWGLLDHDTIQWISVFHTNVLPPSSWFHHFSKSLQVPDSVVQFNAPFQAGLAETDSLSAISLPHTWCRWQTLSPVNKMRLTTEPSIGQVTEWSALFRQVVILLMHYGINRPCQSSAS